MTTALCYLSTYVESLPNRTCQPTVAEASTYTGQRLQSSASLLMRILYLNNMYDADGVSLGSAMKIRCLAEELTRLGHEVDIQWLNPQAFPRQSDGHSRAEPHRHSLIRSQLRGYLSVPRALMRDLASWSRTREAIEAFSPDVVMLRLDFCRVAAAELTHRRGLPLVVEADAPVVHERQRYIHEARFGLGTARWCERRVLERAAGIFAQSEVTRQLLVDAGAPSHNFRVVPNGADPNRMAGPEARSSTRDKLCLARVPVIGFVGAFNSFHGIDKLLEAIPEVSSRHPDARYLLVGGGGNREADARRFAEANEAVVVTGRVPHDDVQAFLAAMDIAVAPYGPERNFYFSPIKVFEYMAAGRLVVAPALGQITELIRHEETGLLYNPWDNDALRRCLLHALSLPSAERRRIGRSARRVIQERFTWSHAAHRVEALIKNVLEQSVQH